MRTTRLTLAACALLSGVWALPASAADTMGQQLSNGCTSCHGIEGRSQTAVPPLAGRPADELRQLLLAYKAQKAPATIMNRIARGYTDDEIAALAAYFSSVSAQ
jgi:cytochrome subunit of sulfide dehydrogenase